MSTTTRRKYRFADRAAAEDAQAESEHMGLLYRWSLADAILGKVRWNVGRFLSVACMRPNAACGGWLLVRQPGDTIAGPVVWTVEGALRMLRSELRGRAHRSQPDEEADELIAMLTWGLRGLGRNPDDCYAYE